MRVDTAVIGAGIIGCMVAREIVARAPTTSVLVLDRDTVGSGASRRSAGLHFLRGSTPRVRAMTEYSHDYYLKLRENRPDLPIRPLAMSVVAMRESAPRLREVFLGRARLTPSGELSSEDVRVPRGAGVWTGDGAQYADVYALTQTLARELRPRVGFREGVQVSAIDITGTGVRLRLSTGEAVTAGRVVLAPGPWLAAPAWHALVAPLGARVKKVVALHVARIPAPGDGVVVFQDEDAFLLPLREHGYWLYSYTCTEWDVHPDAMADGLTSDNVEQARASLRRYAPDLAERATSGRVFCDAYSRTGDPRVQALDPEGRVVFAGAANGSGYRLAPAIASEAANLLNLARSHT
jgi:glycine/D-amino acid oxidase-like deaminating enzyme